ncbi:DUF1707 SHOCT-like domain-containing protein [Micromonospora sp. SL4-19]|uniref:DUF1707 SHOCT-like domain-containing protein n=1 Tax=Micromonospora sp. SL4-19 TaxID=3399129 RepID=UPI003A4E4E5F
MDGRDGMRAADTDRQATAERLRVALEEGRLDLHEYDERLQRAYAAKTYGELDAVVVDLPGAAPAERSAVAPRPTGAAGGPPAPVAEDPAPAGAPGVRRSWLINLWLPWLRVAGIMTAIWLFSTMGRGGFVYYWPVWVLGPWGVVILMQTVGGLASGEPQRAVERKRRRRAERDERRRARREGRVDGGRGEPPVLPNV